MIPLTVFANVKDNTGIEVMASIPDIITILNDAAETIEPTARKHAYQAFTCSPFDGTRAKANARGAWMLAMDVDEGWTFDAAVAACEALETPFTVYTTTKSKVSADRFRIVLFLNREVDAATYEKLWIGMTKRFRITADLSTRDISRLSIFPAAWIGAHNRIDYNVGGTPLDVDAILKLYPPDPEPEVQHAPAPAAFVDPRRASLDRLRRMRNGTVDRAELIDFDRSPIVSHRALEKEYTGPAGGRTYRFLCACALKAVKSGYEIDEAILRELGLEFSRRTFRKTDGLNNDVKNALRFARTAN